MNIDRICSRIAAWMGIFGVDWQADFEDDGYRDLRGLAPVGEPLWIDDLAPQPQPVIRVIRPERPARRA